MPRAGFRFRPAFLLLAAGLLALAGCGQNTTQTAAPSVQTSAQAPTVLNRGNGAEPKSLDPAYIDGIWESQIVGDLLMGLATEDEAGKPIPGAAERWETSTDGLVWTFHLRDHLWSDGTPVSAEDFLFAWRRLLDPKTAAAYAYYLYPIKNARAVNTGKMPGTALGVAAPDAKTLVVTLEHPVPFLVEFMTHHTTFPVPRHVVEAKGNAWSRAGSMVSNGPYVLKEWLPNDHISLVKNAKFYDAANVKIDAVNYYPTPDADAALRRLRAGELDVQDPIPPRQIDWLRANMANTLKIEPSLTTLYLTINLKRKPLDDIRIRQAIALGYDRETMVGKILRLGELPAYAMVPPSTANYPGGPALTFKAMPMEARIAKAQELMRAAGYSPEHMLRTTLSTTTSAVTKQTIAPFQQMMRRIYIDLVIVQSDTQVNYQKLQEGDFDLGSAGWVADFNDASNFLDVLRTGGGNNYSRYANPRYDSLLDQAAAEPDLGKRAQLLEQAEQMMLNDYPIVPARFSVTTALVQPYVKNWIANGKEINRSRWLSLAPH